MDISATELIFGGVLIAVVVMSGVMVRFTMAQMARTAGRALEVATLLRYQLKDAQDNTRDIIHAFTVLEATRRDPVTGRIAAQKGADPGAVSTAAVELLKAKQAQLREISERDRRAASRASLAMKAQEGAKKPGATRMRPADEAVFGPEVPAGEETVEQEKKE